MVNTVLIGFEITALEAAEAAEPPEPDSGAETETSGEVNLVPFSNETFGISGLIPEGWSEISPGIYSRGSSSCGRDSVIAAGCTGDC